jgi:hypothetical protein
LNRRLALLAVLALACALRGWGLDHGLPAIDHDDEWYYVRVGASMLERGSPRVRTDGIAPYLNPTGFTLMAAAAQAPLDAWKRGGLPGGEGARARYRADRASYHLAVRLFSAILGVGTVLLVYVGARSFAGPRASLAAAALLATSPLHVRDSHLATNDVALGLAMLAALVVLLRLREHPRGPLAVGALVGVACAIKYSAAPLALPLAVGLVWSPSRGLRADAGRALAGFALAAAGAGLLFFPAALLEPGAVWSSFREQAGFGKAPWPGQDPAPVPLQHGAILLRALGPAGLALGAWGLARLGAARRVEVVGYPLLHLLIFLPMPLFFARFDLPLLGFLALGVAAALRGRSRLVQVALAGLILVPTTWGSVRVASLFAEPDTRAELTAELERRLEASPGRVRVACEPGLVRWLPQGPDGSFDPRLGVTGLGAGACPACGRARRFSSLATAVCMTATCPRHRTEGAAPDPEQALDLLEAGQVDLLALTSHGVGPLPWYTALDAAAAVRGRLLLKVIPSERRPIPPAAEERYGPLIHLLWRERPGPEVRLYALR